MPVEFSKAADVFDQHRSWQHRVLIASLPTTTGAVVRAMLGIDWTAGDAYGQTCDILTDDRVITPVRRNGVWGRPEPIGTVQAVRDNLRRLADHCKLSNADREALFDELRKWVRRDFRAKSEA